VRFAQVACGAGGVEVTQAGVAKSVNAMKPGKHSLDKEFGFPVSIRREKWISLANGSRFRFTVKGCGGGEDNSLDSRAEHALEKGKRIRGVVAEEAFGELHGFAGFDGSGEVHDCVEMAIGKDGIQLGSVGEIGDDQARIFGDCLAMSAGEIVEYRDVVAVTYEFCGNNTSYISGSAGDEDVQEFPREAFSTSGAHVSSTAKWGGPVVTRVTNFCAAKTNSKNLDWLQLIVTTEDITAMTEGVHKSQTPVT
jgi:hypothetical protein